MEKNKCGHTPCTCTIQGDDKYCSPDCEAAAGADVEEIDCECGHPGC